MLFQPQPGYISKEAQRPFSATYRTSRVIINSMFVIPLLRRVLTIVLLPCVLASASCQEADQKFSKYFRDYLETCFHNQPSYASGLGDHRYDQYLEDLSETSMNKWLERDRKALRD